LAGSLASDSQTGWWYSLLFKISYAPTFGSGQFEILKNQNSAAMSALIGVRKNKGMSTKSVLNLLSKISNRRRFAAASRWSFITANYSQNSEDDNEGCPTGGGVHGKHDVHNFTFCI
jgi:hypothetical protein